MIQRKATRTLGNVSQDTEVTYEFGRNKDYVVSAELKELPFQVQIRFNTLEGNQCIRTITRALPITQDRKIAEEEANIEVLGRNVTQQAAKMAFDGAYTKSRNTAYAQKKLMKRVKKDEDEKVYRETKDNLNKMEKKLGTAQIHERESGLALSDDEDDEGESDRKKERNIRRQKTRTESRTKKDSTATFLYQMKRK